MLVRPQSEKIKLYGFNNLTKTLSFNMYDICYTKTVEDRQAYLEYIDEQYNAQRLTGILREVTRIIGAHVLNISVQDYEPQGASVTILICEGDGPVPMHSSPLRNGSADQMILAHLDKSHLTVHTYPEYHPDGGVCTFRADIDVSTCGEISPLNALNYLVNKFDADIFTMDYRVRGFTRDIRGKKLFIDHDLVSIQDYIDDDIIDRYQMIDVNVYQEHIFHTKCKLKEADLDEYLFHFSKSDISEEEIRQITAKLNKERDEIFYGRNMGFQDI
ncbi:MAG: adenosylmethionine decarboxylase [Firmicutes bacterium]|nr:adenosylmethionine decarboxylase [Bacillota bacterium]